MTEVSWPWVFERGGKPSLITSTLETLAVLVALKLVEASVRRDTAHSEDEGCGAPYFDRQQKQRFGSEQTRVLALLRQRPSDGDGDAHDGVEGTCRVGSS